MEASGKRIVSLDQLIARVSEWRAGGLKVGFTCGAFDLLHAGHVDYLQRARGLCDRLIVAVNSDESVRSYKGPFRPINTESHRLSVIAALSCVDATILMHDRRPESLIRTLRPDLYIKGGDYDVSQLRSAPLVHSYGGQCAVIPVNHEISTSKLIRRIEELSSYAQPEGCTTKPGGPIVFLDRDGTIIKNVHFLNKPDRVELVLGAGEGLRTLQDAGFRLIVVTNQQGLGLGYFDYDTFVAVNSQMLRLLSEYGVKISRFYFCPHSFAEKCTCRKPDVGLVNRALKDHGARAEECYLIGDSLADMECAQRSGCKGVFIGEGCNSDCWYCAGSFPEAARHILSSSLAQSSSA
jgi:rfaE bifunctional protein nucleotidyltransferase chain/domain